MNCYLWNTIMDSYQWVQRGIIFHQWGPSNLSILSLAGLPFLLYREKSAETPALERSEAGGCSMFLKRDVLMSTWGLVRHVLSQCCGSPWYIGTLLLLVLGVVIKLSSSQPLFVEWLPCGRCKTKHFVRISPFVPRHMPVRLLLPVNPLYGWKNWGSGKSSDLPKFTMQANDGIELIPKLLPTTKPPWFCRDPIWSLLWGRILDGFQENHTVIPLLGRGHKYITWPNRFV